MGEAPSSCAMVVALSGGKFHPCVKNVITVICFSSLMNQKMW